MGKKFFIFNSQELKYENITYLIYLNVVISFIVGFVFSIFYLKNNINEIIFITEETKTIILNEKNSFDKEKLKAYILELNIKYPHIVYAQAVLESGGFKSKIFLSNHNLFGMKQAKLRPTTALGTELNHAYYDNWKSSVIDYAMFSAAYLKNIKNEDEYYEYLKQNYAEDKEYVNKLKNIVSKENKLK